MSSELNLESVEKMVARFIENARRELDDRWEKWKLDLSKNQVQEVIGGLLARQLSLTTNLASNPGIWNQHIAPMVLRGMADVYITLTWIIINPTERSREYALYGLGQAKLDLEHRRAALEENKERKGYAEALEALEGWINAQQFTFLTEVNVGSWSGKNAREMAKDSGCEDFYSYVYTPFSAAVHSMWQHVGRVNMRECQNPLHAFHKVPIDRNLGVDPHFLYLAGKYWRKTLALFDEKIIGVKVEEYSSFDLLCEDLAAFPRKDDEVTAYRNKN